MISIDAPMEEKDEVAKEQFYTKLEDICNKIPNCNMRIIIGDFKVKVGN